MFVVMGPILLITGLVNDTNLNVISGLSMSAFGIVMLLFGLAGQRKAAAEAKVAVTQKLRQQAAAEPEARRRLAHH